MEALIQEQEKLAKSGNLKKSLTDVQKTIDLLVNAREAISTNPDSAGLTLAKLQNPVRESFDVINNDLKDVYKKLNNYDKSLAKKFNVRPVHNPNDNDALSTQPELVNRAVMMHLLREGSFDVASQLVVDAISQAGRSEDMDVDPTMEKILGIDAEHVEELRKQFAAMYHVLYELKRENNLQPAIEWATDNSQRLIRRGSNLEFELGRLQFVWLFTGSANPDRPNPQQALEYARSHFQHFQERYMREITELGGAMAYTPNLKQSPYRQIFLREETWTDLSNKFTREFCSLLRLSADSPLYLAATAGAIALPTFLKYQTIAKAQKTEWTTQQELPVEIPLPPSFRFHSIFVCPVSREQTTDENPPMMMSCGHVIAQETMARMSRGAMFKCPYCPVESRPSEAQKLYM